MPVRLEIGHVWRSWIRVQGHKTKSVAIVVGATSSEGFLVKATARRKRNFWLQAVHNCSERNWLSIDKDVWAYITEYWRSHADWCMVLHVWMACKSCRRSWWRCWDLDCLVPVIPCGIHAHLSVLYRYWRSLEVLYIFVTSFLWLVLLWYSEHWDQS